MRTVESMSGFSPPSLPPSLPLPPCAYLSLLQVKKQLLLAAVARHRTHVGPVGQAPNPYPYPDPALMCEPGSLHTNDSEVATGSEDGSVRRRDVQGPYSHNALLACRALQLLVAQLALLAPSTSPSFAPPLPSHFPLLSILGIAPCFP